MRRNGLLAAPVEIVGRDHCLGGADRGPFVVEGRTPAAVVFPAGAVARRVAAFLSALPPDPPRQMELPANLAIFTAPLPDADVLRPKLAEFGFPGLRVIDLVGGETAAKLPASSSAPPALRT